MVSTTTCAPRTAAGVLRICSTYWVGGETTGPASQRCELWGEWMTNKSRELSASRPAPHARSAVELKSIIESERAGLPFLLWRDADGTQQILTLAERRHATVGRRASNDIVLSGDSEVSRTHAELELIGEDWTVSDDGLSRNGTFVNGKRIAQRRRLVDGDVLVFGTTIIEFRAPGENSTTATASGSYLAKVQALTEIQRKVLIALCRPYKTGGAYATPASNQQIADEVFMVVDAVKKHLRLLFQRFEIADLPQNQKRTRLVECAFQWGLVSERDL